MLTALKNAARDKAYLYIFRRLQRKNINEGEDEIMKNIMLVACSAILVVLLSGAGQAISISSGITNEDFEQLLIEIFKY